MLELGDPPNLVFQVVVEFADHAGLERMLASSERQALRPRVLAQREMFDGAMSHIDFEVGADLQTQVDSAF